MKSMNKSYLRPFGNIHFHNLPLETSIPVILIHHPRPTIPQPPQNGGLPHHHLLDPLRNQNTRTINLVPPQHTQPRHQSQVPQKRRRVE